MADTSGADALTKALLSAGGVTLGIVATAFGKAVQGWMSGTTEQEKELRGGLAEEVKRLREDLTKADNEIKELRADLKSLDRRYMYVFREREKARARVNALEEQHGLASTVWPPDPDEHLATD